MILAEIDWGVNSPKKRSEVDRPDARMITVVIVIQDTVSWRSEMDARRSVGSNTY